MNNLAEIFNIVVNNASQIAGRFSSSIKRGTKFYLNTKPKKKEKKKQNLKDPFGSS